MNNPTQKSEPAVRLRDIVGIFFLLGILITLSVCDPVLQEDSPQPPLEETEASEIPNYEVEILAFKNINGVVHEWDEPIIILLPDEGRNFLPDHIYPDCKCPEPAPEPVQPSPTGEL